MAYRVMILEDDPFIALDMEDIIQNAGYDVVGPIADADQAMAIVRSDDAPDCVLLDFRLRGGTTENIARELGRLGVPYMYVTGNTADVRKALPVEAPLVRAKPVHERRIVRDVRDLLAA